MNATVIAPKSANLRLNRIKIICRVLKIVLLLDALWLAYPLAHGLIFTHHSPYAFWLFYGKSYATWTDVPKTVQGMTLLGVGLKLAILITSYQLLSLYESGVVFSPGNVRLMQRLGALAITYGSLTIMAGLIFTLSTTDALGIILLKLLAIIDSPWVIGGTGVIALAYIMDEGRKIQEEQELTV